VISLAKLGEEENWRQEQLAEESVVNLPFGREHQEEE